ncbi:hypothetical protein BN8_00803 [Fibrisoma limi BUZ 3]|uniref:Uncharacterized protein n=1 Tax=Fibrisoma limi BUZ 3 TaxID=1185876 RepID=I2GD76_9BACT|nr:hypothetical protein [Fibrisoma limi]CCH51850.1 hypothetical protein BN8_00803 [Fibrisoma limi BUZ 3]
MENKPNTPANASADKLQEAKTVITEKFEHFKTEAGQHLSAAAAHLDELKDQLVARATEATNDIDVEGLKAQATQQFEAAKATAAEKLSALQAQAETVVAAASVKVDELVDQADDKFDEMRAEAAVQLQVAQQKLDDLRAEAAVQIEEAKERAKALWGQLFGDKEGN